MARKKRAVRPSGPPLPFRALVDDLFVWLKLDEPARAFRALRAFSRAAGPRIRERARAERLRGSTLYVRVSSSGWSQELHTLKSPLLAKLRRTPGGESVEDLRFTVGPLDELPDWDAVPEPVAPDPSLPKPSKIVDEPMGVELAQAVEEVRDPELREALIRLLARPSSKAPPR